jgi:Secretion system C-terminal sorting domain
VLGGGGGQSGSGPYVISCTMGQTFVGIASGPGGIAEAGFWYQLYQMATEVEEAPPPLPTEFGLGPNVPNPFNPRTTLAFSVPVRAHVTIRLYDVKGRLVMTVVDEELDPGYHTRTLEMGRLGSGVYIARMIAGDFARTRKLVLIE